MLTPIVRIMFLIMLRPGIMLGRWFGWCRVRFVSRLPTFPGYNGEYEGMESMLICVCIGNCWKTAFAFELVNTIFFFWMIIMSWQVNRDVYD